MVRTILMCIIVVLFCTGCDLNTREEALRKKEAELTQREQLLSLREKTLALREEEVLKLKQKLDSVQTKVDTALMYNQKLVGRWNVKMTCTATTCPGSAVGDTKTETWDISYQDNYLIAKVIANDKLTRVYTGSYDGEYLLLSQNVANVPAEPTTRMTIRLAMTDENTMEGQRVIDRENDCRIVYSLQLQKQQPSSK